MLVAELHLQAPHRAQVVQLRACSGEERVLVQEVRLELQPAAVVAHEAVVALEHSHVVGRPLLVETVVMVVIVQGQLLVGRREVEEKVILRKGPEQHHQRVVGLLVVRLE